MKTFNFQTPTHLYFGIGEEKNVGKYIKERGYRRVFFHYGKSSIKRSGLYDTVVSSLKEAGLFFTELGGVEANPESKLVRKGVEICRREKIDFILAVGGGSVIDSAKSIAHGIFYDGDPFDFNLHLAIPLKSLPVGVILTIAAAGSEMSTSCVISDVERQIKKGFNSESNRPVFAIENPVLTYSLPSEQTAYGIVDILSHTFERYFNASSEIEFADYIAEGLMRSVLIAGETAIREPDNYDARATLMVASGYSHNGLTGLGKVFSFPIHQLEHIVSAVRRDIAHGAGLACLIPAWYSLIAPLDVKKAKKFAVNVMGVEEADSDEETIARGGEALTRFLASLKIPLRLRAYGIDETDIENMVKRLPETIEATVPLTKALAREIYLRAL